MPLRMTRRDVFQKLTGIGIAALASGLSLAGCTSNRREQPQSKPSDSNAPSAGEKDMRKYVCGKCGNVHDPAASDPPKPFEDLPADWTCPKCGSPKSRFAPKT